MLGAVSLSCGSTSAIASDAVRVERRRLRRLMMEFGRIHRGLHDGFDSAWLLRLLVSDTRTRKRVCMCVCVHARVCVCVCVWAPVCALCVYACLYIGLHTYIHLHCVCIYIYIYICVRYIYIYMVPPPIDLPFCLF